MRDPAIAVLPYGKTLGPGLGKTPLADLHWPLGQPAQLQGKHVSDLTTTDHLIIFPKMSMHSRLRKGTKARISLIMGEPSVIHARHHRMLRLTHTRFHRILTFNPDLVDTLPNARFLPFGTTWVPDWQTLDTTKTRMCSLIASAKRDTQGHKLRHEIANWCQQNALPVDIMGKGYKPFERKSDGLAPYRYSIVIENMPERNYFSEKLVDAVLCGTVPIYWGCPNLEDFFDPKGIIQCRDAASIKAAVQAMSAEDFARRQPDIDVLKPRLAEYADWEKRAAQLIQAEL